MELSVRPLEWAVSAKKDLRGMPAEVQGQFGHELFMVQAGETPASAKPWKGEGAGVFELVADHDRATYRAVYTVRFEEAVYVLHCFQKKSKTGVKTPQSDVALIRLRLKLAKEDYDRKYGEARRR